MSRPPQDDWVDDWSQDGEPHPDAIDQHHPIYDDHDLHDGAVSDHAHEGETYDHHGDVFDDHLVLAEHDSHHEYDEHDEDPATATASSRASRHQAQRHDRHEKGAERSRSSGRRDDRRTRHPLLGIVAVLVALAVVGGGGFIALRALDLSLPSFSLPGAGGGGAAEDYPGPGSGEVVVQIPQGAGGDQIGRILAENNVVASAAAFSAIAVANPDARAIQPGTYRMAEEMSAEGALNRLLDPAYRTDARVTFPEGLWQEEVYARLASATDYEVADYEAVDIAELNLPETANGDLEGYLFPETYSFGPEETPADHLQKMIDQAVQRHEALGLSEEDAERTLIVASIIQAEVNNADDLPRVARVIENRLDDGGRLEMDSTVHFIHKQRGLVGTTNEQRASDDPYNTYRIEGLPPGPINSPGDDAIRAAMDPAESDWRFFVTVNPETGETVFSETFAEHEEAVADFLVWCRENPESC